VDGPALIGIIAGPLAGDHDIDAVVSEDALELDDIDQARDVFEDQRFVGEEARDHQRERRVLGPGDGNGAVQPLTTDYAYPIHIRPARLAELKLARGSDLEPLPSRKSCVEH
jgi:hypothetical protein